MMPEDAEPWTSDHTSECLITSNDAQQCLQYMSTPNNDHWCQRTPEKTLTTPKDTGKCPMISNTYWSPRMSDSTQWQWSMNDDASHCLMIPHHTRGHLRITDDTLWDQAMPIDAWEHQATKDMVWWSSTILVDVQVHLTNTNSGQKHQKMPKGAWQCLNVPRKWSQTIPDEVQQHPATPDNTWKGWTTPRPFNLHSLTFGPHKATLAKCGAGLHGGTSESHGTVQLRPGTGGASGDFFQTCSFIFQLSRRNPDESIKLVMASISQNALQHHLRRRSLFIYCIRFRLGLSLYASDTNCTDIQQKSFTLNTLSIDNHVS